MTLNMMHIIFVIVFAFFYVIGPDIWKLGRQNYHLELCGVLRQTWRPCYADCTITFLNKLFRDHFKIKNTLYIIYLCDRTLHVLAL